MLDKLTSADFLPYLNETFLIHFGEDEPWETELIEVSELKHQRAGTDEVGLDQQAFSIVFRSPKVDIYLPQSIYAIEHEKMGRLELFLVPIGRDKHGMCYEAIFT